jgi:hypothetical protein
MHVDHHGYDWGPGSSPVMYNGNDGGVYRSIDDGDHWTKLPDLPVTQAYRVALDANNPYALYIGAQDNGTCRTLDSGTDNWSNVFGGDGFQPLIHPDDSFSIWAQFQYGSLYFSGNNGASWASATIGVSSSDRRNWNSPHVQDPTIPDQRYFGTNKVYRSTGDRTWSVISPDLTGNPGGNPGQVDGTLTTIAVSPHNPNVIWTGSNDGYVQLTTNGGGDWFDLSGTLPQRWVTSVRVDPFTEEVAYVTISGFRWNEYLPRVYRTSDYGATWDPISGNLPDAPVNDFLADPDRQNRYFVATDVGVYETWDGGTTWSMLGSDLPNVVCTSMALDRDNQLLVVGTYGRSLFSRIINPDHLFVDGFESGDTSAWSGSVP